MSLSHRENYLRAARFETPERIPMGFHINGACWNHYPHDALYELMIEHPLLFPGFEKPKEYIEPEVHPVAKAGVPYTDAWGCVWETTDDGIVGTVTRHPLANWDAFDAYQPADPNASDGLGPADWKAQEHAFAENKRNGGLASGGLKHGHFFLQLCDIRGYENLMMDMMNEEPRLEQLIGMIEDFNMAIVQRFVDWDAELMSYPEDLGMQVGPMLSPDHFRRYIKPTYERLMAPAREASCLVHMHSDGDIRTLVDDLIAGGVEIINLQDLVNGIDWIADRFAGKTCIEIDIDRQKVTRFGTPAEIDALILEEVEKLGCKQGGLMMVYGLYPGVPLENARALMDAMEKYSTYYA